MGKVGKGRKKTQKKNHARGLLEDMEKNPPLELRRYYEKLRNRENYDFAASFGLMGDKPYNPNDPMWKRPRIIVNEVNMDSDSESPPPPPPPPPPPSGRRGRTRRGRTRRAHGKKSKKSRTKRGKSHTKRGKSRAKRRRTRR